MPNFVLDFGFWDGVADTHKLRRRRVILPGIAEVMRFSKDMLDAEAVWLPGIPPIPTDVFSFHVFCREIGLLQHDSFPTEATWQTRRRMLDILFPGKGGKFE